MEFCIDKKTKERIFAFDIKNEYGIKDFFLEKKLRRMSANEELVCPECGTPVILRAGEINIPHFSHKIKTKDCFYSTYTYNENRVKALKILYDKLKKYEDVEILGLTKNFKGYGTIDILLERGVYKKRKYAIMIKNTMENINKWEKLHIELLKEEIAPIYFNYGTTKEINDFQKEISKSFFYRNLMNLTTNHGIRLVNLEEQEFYSISTTFYLNENNRLKNYKNILHKNDYKDSIEFIYNSVGRDLYTFLNSEKQHYTKEILKYREDFKPFLMIDSNREILLVTNVDNCISIGENKFKTLEIKYISLSYYRFSLVNPNQHMYFYPKGKLFKKECFADYYSVIENKEEQLEEFFEYSDFDITKIIPIEEAGFFKNNIEEFIKNYKEIKNKLFDYDYLSEDSKKEFRLYKLENLNDCEEDNFIENKKKPSPSNENINFLKLQVSNFYEVQFRKSYLGRILYTLEDYIFICSNEKEVTELENLYNILKNLSKIKASSKEYFKLLFSKEEIVRHNLTKLFFDVFNKNETIFNYQKLSFFCPKGKILSFIDNNDFELNILNTYYKLIKKESIEDKKLEIFKDSLEVFFKNKDLDLFLKNIDRIEKEYQEKFLIEHLDIIIKNKTKNLLIFIVNNIDLNKSFEEKYENLDCVLAKNSILKKYNSFMEKIKVEKNIVLFDCILGTKYEKLLSIKNIANILSFNYNSTSGKKIVEKYILKNKENLNIKNKEGHTLFSYLCSIASNADLITLCLENGADLYTKNLINKTPFMELEKRIEKGQLNNFKLPQK